MAIFNYLMETFGTWLLKELEKQRMTQSDLALACGISPAQMSRVISGARSTSKKTLTNIATTLRLPPKLVYEKAGAFRSTTADPWADEIAHKLSLLDPTRKALADKVLTSLLDEQEKEAGTRKKASHVTP